ncbi:MAG: ABC transporter substrate-binding protein [Bacilli bacterium]|nr:ABC transporter substrate-binding protein [Bacilli bacterium]
MKKILLIFLIILLLIFYLFSHNKKDHNSNKITLAEVTHSIFYAPLYVAIENDYFKDEGLDIELVLTSGADKVSAAIISGDAQIGLAGAESAIYIYNSGEKDYLQIFSGLTKRDGQFILGRKRDEKFTLDKLKNKEVLVGRKGGMPSLNFINALDNSVVNTKNININYQIDFASLSGAFISGTGDYVNLFEPNATMLEKNNQGYILSSIGKYSGEMPYTVFYAKKSYINNNSDLCKKFTSAINKGLEYVKNHEPIEIAEIISKQFPDNSIKELEQMIKHYKDADTWLSNSIVTESSLKNLEDLLIKNNLIKDYVPYKKLVKNYE